MPTVYEQLVLKLDFTVIKFIRMKTIKSKDFTNFCLLSTMIEICMTRKCMNLMYIFS